MRPSAVRCAVMLATVVLFTGCDKPSADSKTDSAKKGEEAKVDPDADPWADEEEANFASPTVEPPPAPKGTMTLPDPWLYVQTCAESHPCPELLQAAGDAHCRELELSGHVNWRLPTKDEVPRFKGVEGLDVTKGYHWTRTPWDEDQGHVWVVDPEDTTQQREFTTPRDRKPFRIRCVKEP